MTPPQTARTLSVVIPCLNDGELLRECLASLQKQTIAADEIIVVDNGSTDDSVNIAEAAGALVIHEPRRGITWASAAGYDAAAGDVIVRIDADVTVDPDFLARYHSTWDHAATTTGRTVVAITGTGTFNLRDGAGQRIADLYLGAYRTTTRLALGHFPIFGSNCSINRQWWLDVCSGINLANTFVHEDMYFSFFVRPHETIWYQQDLSVHMDPRALHGAHQLVTRLARGFHTIRSAWKDEPVYLRLARRGIITVKFIPGGQSVGDCPPVPC